jgi:hypothetical protein
MDWQQDFPVTGPPGGGPVIVGAVCAAVPVGGQLRFTVANPPLDSGWNEIQTPNESFGIQQDWPADVDTTMTLYYDGPDLPAGASIQPWLAVVAPEAPAVGAWQKDFPVKGPDGDGSVVQVGVRMIDIPPQSQVRFTLPAGNGVPALDSGEHTVLQPNESYALQQTWPNDYATTLTLSFALTGQHARGRLRAAAVRGQADPSRQVRRVQGGVVADGDPKLARARAPEMSPGAAARFANRTRAGERRRIRRVGPAPRRPDPPDDPLAAQAAAERLDQVEMAEGDIVLDPTLVIRGTTGCAPQPGDRQEGDAQRRARRLSVPYARPMRANAARSGALQNGSDGTRNRDLRRDSLKVATGKYLEI